MASHEQASRTSLSNWSASAAELSRMRFDTVAGLLRSQRVRAKNGPPPPRRLFVTTHRQRHTCDDTPGVR